MPGLVTFESSEIRRLEDAELILLGVQPSELPHMSLQLRADVLEIKRAKHAVENGKMPK